MDLFHRNLGNRIRMISQTLFLKLLSSSQLFLLFKAEQKALDLVREGFEYVFSTYWGETSGKSLSLSKTVSSCGKGVQYSSPEMIHVQS